MVLRCKAESTELCGLCSAGVAAGKKVGAKSIVEHLGVGRTAFVGKYEIKV